MTDKQIIKDLQACIDGDCQECSQTTLHFKHCQYPLIKDAVDLINRQKSEIENYSITEKDLRYRNKEFEKANKKQAEYIKELEKENDELRDYLDSSLTHEREMYNILADERAEAIKEFAEKLKKCLHTEDFETPDERWKPESEFAYAVDFLVKEMTEVEK